MALRARRRRAVAGLGVPDDADGAARCAARDDARGVGRALRALFTAEPPGWVNPRGGAGTGDGLHER